MSKRGKASGRVRRRRRCHGGKSEIRNIEIRKGADRADARNRLPAGYWKACELRARGGMRTLGRRICGWHVVCESTNPRLRALVQNDLAVLDAIQGKLQDACEQWRGVVDADEACLPARLNFGLIRAEMSWSAANENSKVENQNGNLKLEIRNPKSEGPRRGRGCALPCSACCSTGRQPAAGICTRRGWLSFSGAMGLRYGTSMPSTSRGESDETRDRTEGGGRRAEERRRPSGLNLANVIGAFPRFGSGFAPQ